MKTLADVSDLDLLEEIERRHLIRKNRPILVDSPLRWWEVTTEGDCEGRSTTYLGRHYGHLVDIAIALRGAVNYKLTFKPIERKYDPSSEVSIDLSSIVNKDKIKATDMLTFLGAVKAEATEWRIEGGSNGCYTILLM